ncbi:hypothetical protein KAR50_00450 [Periweissella fabaria]|uniref:DNA methylase n=1 Tax=Periweissella fabaria TaxID=546157 RepID=A0ABM8Z8S5_9LACO|nr:hypothetical protein [Periweissella fabaria]MCM0596331.1 hypothetical protein [Periweissella fabaria]CAH0417566.1 hypothetical protein WFA24289_01908 [Periweissella fabaria]
MANSPSHVLGTAIGGLFEDTLKYYLKDLADADNLFMDYQHPRIARNNKKKVTWKDNKNNSHDLDIVLEKNGSEEKLGKPVAFIEMAWRRYTKHSKNKAEEIGDVLTALNETFSSTKPFFGAVIVGEWTRSAILQLESKGIVVAEIQYKNFVNTIKSITNIDIGTEEDTSEDDLQKKATDLVEHLSKEQNKEKVIKKIIDDNSLTLKKFKIGLQNHLQRQIAEIVVSTLYGQPKNFSDITTAVNYLNAETSPDSSLPIDHIYIMIKYNNGSEVTGRYKTVPETIQFLNNI